MNRCIKLELPFPISINHFYGQHGNRRFIKREGVAFIEKVKEIVTESAVLQGVCDGYFEGDLKYEMWIYPPDKRKRDGDNLIKQTQDSLQKAGVYLNDCQIVEWHIYKLPEIIKGGKIFVRVEELN